MKKQFLFLTFLLFTGLSLSQKMETLEVHWPDEYKWKIGSNEENEQMHFMEVVPGNETVENWTIIGTMISLKNMKGVPLDKVMDITYEQSKGAAPKAKLTLIEKSDTWILFKIESPSFKDDKNPESQLIYVVQGEQTLYTNMVAIKEKKLSDEFVQKWSEVFKSSKLVFQ